MINTSIRRALVLSSLVLGATTLFSSKAMADTVTLGGSVVSTLTLVTTPTAAAIALPLSTGTQQIVQVADLAISTNEALGYTLTATSGNLAKAGGTTSIAYQVTTTADAVTVVAGDFAIASGTNYTFASTAANAVGTGSRDLYIRYTPAALQDPGAYAGTITVTVADN